MISWVFLALAGLFVLLDLNSFRPVRNNRVLYVPSFFASWLTNELASIYLFVQLLVVGLFVGPGGALDQPAGWAGLALMAVAWALLAVLHQRGRQAGPAVDEALTGWGDHHQPAPASGRRIRKVRNVTFHRVAGKNIRLDLTLPEGDGERRPALLQIHGGGWVIGDKREQGLPLLKRMASNGWVGINANYRLSPGATWPEHVIDCKRAVAWVREHADEYGIDPSFIAVTGGSAGGHLSSMVALTAADRSLQPGFEDADVGVQAAVPFYGVYDFTNRLDTQFGEMRGMVLEPMVMKRFYDEDPVAFSAASPMDRVHPDAPPFFVVHGDLDTLAPVEDARHFVELLRAASDQPVFYAEIPGAQHAFEIFSSPRTRRTLQGVQRFLFEAHDRHVRARAGASAEDAGQATSLTSPSG